MAQAFECDRCGTKETGKSEVVHAQGTFSEDAQEVSICQRRTDTVSGVVFNARADLCKKCLKEFRAWWFRVGMPMWEGSVNAIDREEV